MRESIVGLLEKADLAIASAAGLVEDRELKRVVDAASSLRVRLGYPEDVLIVALAGGTGSGKSSLVNAIVGEEIAEVGGVRPTTDRPLAVASASRLESVSGYLTDLGIDTLTPAAVDEWLCLIDLPDTDSVDHDHRLQVGKLLPRIDAVIWVMDPEKYRDAALHSGYLESLAAHVDRFVFALNQSDRLGDDERPLVIEDLRNALMSDGMAAPKIVATSASPPAGPPIGVEELLIELESLRGHAVLNKVLTDLGEACIRMLDSIGSSGLEFRQRSDEVVERTAALIAEGSVEKATNDLIHFLDQVGGEAGEPTGRRIREVTAMVPGHVQAARDELVGPVDGGWFASLRGWSHRGEDESASRATESIEARLIGPVREILRERASAIAALTDLSLSVTAIRERLSV